MTPDPRLAFVLADLEVQEAAKKYDDAMKVVFASFANEEGRAGSPHEGVIDRADDAWRGLFVAILAAADRWNKNTPARVARRIVEFYNVQHKPACLKLREEYPNECSCGLRAILENPDGAE